MKVQQDPKFVRRLDSASAKEQDTANSTSTGLLNPDEAARVPTRAYLGDAELTTQEYSNVSPRNLESKRRSLADDARDRLANAKNVPFSAVSSDVPSTQSYAADLPCVSSMPPPPVPKRARTSLPRSTGGGQKNDSSVRSLVSSWRRRNIKMMLWPVLWHPRRNIHGCRMTRSETILRPAVF